jgi:hypothetical protein
VQRLLRLEVTPGAEGLLPAPQTVAVDDGDPEDQDLLGRSDPADGLHDRGASPGEQVVVVAEHLDPVAGADLDGPVHVLDDAERRRVADVLVATWPAGQQLVGDLAGGVVVGAVRNRDLDVLGDGRRRADDRAQHTANEVRVVARVDGDRDQRPSHLRLQ